MVVEVVVPAVPDAHDEGCRPVQVRGERHRRVGVGDDGRRLIRFRRIDRQGHAAVRAPPAQLVLVNTQDGRERLGGAWQYDLEHRV
jgi:hypothetical protein